MTPLGWHLILRLQGDHVLVPSVAERRRLAQAFVRLAGEFPLLAWRATDADLHVLGCLTDAQAETIVRKLRTVFAHLHPGVPLLLVRQFPIQGQWQLAESFRRVLRVDRHVGTDSLLEGSVVLDMLGMRAVGAQLAARVRERLPQISPDELLPHLGLGGVEELCALEHLADATAAAFALPELEGKGAEPNAARAAGIVAADGLPAEAVAAALGVSVRTVERVRADNDVPPAHRRAVRLQMGLRAARAQALSA